jgi:hypothetical protein
VRTHALTPKSGVIPRQILKNQNIPGTTECYNPEKC